jgi:HlyD family secretion protein
MSVVSRWDRRQVSPVDAFPNKTFQGKVKQIRKAPVNIQNVVTYTVLISADNPDLKLLPGMTANARIVVEKKDKVLKVANTALRFRMPQGDKNAANRVNKNSDAQATPWWKFWKRVVHHRSTSVIKCKLYEYRRK